jgi:hypothetical protein
LQRLVLEFATTNKTNCILHEFVCNNTNTLMVFQYEKS